MPSRVKESALILKTNKVKQGLLSQIDHWKAAFSKELLKRVQTTLEKNLIWIRNINGKIVKPVNDIDSLGNVMQALEEVRQKHSLIASEFKPLLLMQTMLELYIDYDQIEWVGNKDPQTVLTKDWI
jgi:dynein heavy chain